MTHTWAASAVVAAPPAAALLGSFSRVPVAAAAAMSSSSNAALRKCSHAPVTGLQRQPRMRGLGPEQRRVLHWLLSPGGPDELQQQHQVGFRALWGGRLSPGERAAATRERLQQVLQQRRSFAAATDFPERKSNRSTSPTSRENESSRGGENVNGRQEPWTAGDRSSSSSGSGSSTSRSDFGFAYSSDPEKQQKVVEAVRRGDAEPSGAGFTFRGTEMQPDETSPQKLKELQERQQREHPFLTETPEGLAAQDAASMSDATGDAVAGPTAGAARGLGSAAGEAVREKAAAVKENVKEGAGAASAAAKGNIAGAAEGLKDGAAAAKEAVKGKAAAASETVREGAAAAGRALRDTATKSASAAGLKGSSGGSSLGSKLLLAGGAGLLLYALWGGGCLLRETEALRTAWDFVKKDERVKAQMGKDFTRERWWGGFEHADSARVKLRLRGRNGERGLAVCDLTRDHPGAQWRVLVVNFVRTDDRAPPPSPPQRQQYQQPPQQQHQPVQPQHHLQQQQQHAQQQREMQQQREAQQEKTQQQREAQQQKAQQQHEQQQHKQQQEEDARQRRKTEEAEQRQRRQQEEARSAEEEGEQRRQQQQEAARRQHGQEHEDSGQHVQQRRADAHSDRRAHGGMQEHAEKHQTEEAQKSEHAQQRQQSNVRESREKLQEDEKAKLPREHPATPRKDETEEELFRRSGSSPPLHSPNRMQAQKLPAVPAGAFKPPLEEDATLPWKVKAIEKEESLKRGGELRSGPEPPPAPYTRP